MQMKHCFYLKLVEITLSACLYIIPPHQIVLIPLFLRHCDSLKFKLAALIFLQVTYLPIQMFESLCSELHILLYGCVCMNKLPSFLGVSNLCTTVHIFIRLYFYILHAD